VAANHDLSNVAFRRLGMTRPAVRRLVTPPLPRITHEDVSEYHRPRMSLLASCVSSSGLGCGHWSEFVYACKRAWPEVLAGLVLAGFIGVAGRGHPQHLRVAVGLGIAVIVGFIAYYLSL
jgi:hypothetical protein